MTIGDNYLSKAVEFFGLADAEKKPSKRRDFENMARAYMRLYEQARRNQRTDVVYEPPPPKLNDIGEKSK
jgi:hypothetical protein